MNARTRIDAIHRSWYAASTREEVDAAVRRMIDTPSEEWKHYLDELYLVRRYGQGEHGLAAIRVQALADHEEELYGAVAEAISRRNGIQHDEGP